MSMKMDTSEKLGKAWRLSFGWEGIEMEHEKIIGQKREMVTK
jgi:hypothetical protein